MLTTTVHAQFNNSQLVTKIWNHVTGNPGDTLNWTAEVLDASRNLIVIGNNLQSNQTTDMLLTKYKASDGSVLWQVQYDNSGNDDFGIAVVVDPSKNIYTATTSYVNSTNGYDWIIQKYDSTGTVQWTKTLNSGFYDVPTDMKYDGSGHLYVTGVRTTTTTLQDYCTVKYDASNGNELWSAPSIYDYTNLVDIPAAITIGGSGRIIVAGGSGSTLTNWDFATVKYSPGTGAQVNVTRNPSSGLGFDQPTSIAKDQYDNIYVTGYAAVTGNSYDIKIVKLDTALSTVWSVTYDGGDHLDDRALCIGVDASGYVYVTGYATKTNGGTDIVVIKYNSVGTQQWVKKYSAPDPTKKAIGRKLDIDPYGNILIVGDAYNIGNTDILSLAYDINGNKKWEEWFNGAGNGDDKASAIKIDDASNYFYVTGKVWTGVAYQYATIKYQTIDYITPPDTEACPNWYAYVENGGQVIGSNDSLVPQVKFYNNHDYPSTYFQNSKVSFVFTKVDTDQSTTDTLHRVDLSFQNGLSTKPYYVSPHIQGYLNFFESWCSSGVIDIRGYQRLLYPEIYKEIDAMFYGNSDGIKLYFICDVGSRPTDIQMKFTGAVSTSIISNKLVVTSSIGQIMFDQATAYQVDAGGNIITLGWQPTYSSLGSNKYGFTLGSYDASKPIIIVVKKPHSPNGGNGDPSNIWWSTYVTTSGVEQCSDIKTTSDDDIYVGGQTFSITYPQFTGITNNLIYYPGYWEVFVAHFDKNAIPQWITYYGGSNSDLETQIVPIPSKDVFVSFITASPDLVSKHANGQYFENYGTDFEGYILDLNYLGNNFSWSTYLQGVWNLYSSQYIPAAGGQQAKVILGGEHEYQNNTTLLASQDPGSSYHSDTKGEGFLITVNIDGTLYWGTRFGGNIGNGDEKINDIYVVSSDDILVCGTTQNTNNYTFPTASNYPAYPNAYVQTNNSSNGEDAFVSEFDGGGGLVWSTLFGGSDGYERGLSIWEDKANPSHIYLTGEVAYPSGTTTLPFDQTYPPGNYVKTNLADGAGWINQFSNQGVRLWGSILEGTNSATGVIANEDKIIACGKTTLTNLPYQSNGSAYFDNSLQNNWQIDKPDQDIFFMGFDFGGNKIYASYFGGDDVDDPYRLFYSQGYYYLCGGTSALDVDIPLWDPDPPFSYFQDQANPMLDQISEDGFVSKFGINFAPVGIAEINQDQKQLSVFPNPNSGSFQINVPQEITDKQFHYEIFSVTGIKVASGELNQRDTQIKLDCGKGLFLLKVFNDSSIYFTKVIVN